MLTCYQGSMQCIQKQKGECLLKEILKHDWSEERHTQSHLIRWLQEHAKIDPSVCECRHSFCCLLKCSCYICSLTKLQEWQRMVQRKTHCMILKYFDRLICRSQFLRSSQDALHSTWILAIYWGKYIMQIWKWGCWYKFHSRHLVTKAKLSHPLSREHTNTGNWCMFQHLAVGKSRIVVVMGWSALIRLRADTRLIRGVREK